MADFTITHRIEAPALVEALNNLAAALSGNPIAAVPAEEYKVIPFTPKQDIPAQMATAENPTPAPVTNTVNGGAPATTSVPTAAVPSPAPSATAAPAQTATSNPVSFDDIVAAGSQLLDAGRMSDLLALLKRFGVHAITQLKPEQYADVAVALRELGAKI